MNFLKAFGQAVLKGGAIIQNFLPLGAQVAAAINPGVAVSIAELSSIIGAVEAVGNTLQLAGPDKLKAATPLIAQALLQSDFLAKHKIANAALFAKASEEFAQATVDLLNALDGAALNVTQKTT